MIRLGLILFILLININLSHAHPVDDVECLAKNVYYEGRHLSISGQAAIVFVVLNRVKSPKYPNSICGVVWQHKQFSWTHDGKSDIPKEETVYQLITIFITEMLRRRDELVDFTLGADHYHARYVSPCWLPDMRFLVKIDEHLFYKKVRSTGNCNEKVVPKEV